MGIIEPQTVIIDFTRLPPLRHDMLVIEEASEALLEDDLLLVETDEVAAGCDAENGSEGG